jgi:uncharacterized membrane protein
VVVGVASEVIGGPVGRHARFARRFWTPLRIILALTCAMMAANWVQKSPCRDGQWADHLQYTKACYTDVLALYYAEGLDQGAVPYIDHPVEYPVLTGVMMGVIGLPIHAAVDSGLAGRVQDTLRLGGDAFNEGRAFYDLTALALAICALLTAWALVQMRPHRPWDAAMFALAPLMLLTATVNWDLLAVAFCTLALYAWAKKRPAWAGVLCGLGVAAKLYPLFLLGPLLLLCLRSRRFRAAAELVGSAVAVWVAVNLPVYLLAPQGWSTFWRFSSERGVDWGTLWYILNQVPLGQKPDGQPRLGVPYLTNFISDVSWLNRAAPALFLLGCAGIAALVFFAPRPPRVGQVAFLVVAVFLLTSKVWSQQFVLWLIPLAILARPKWGAFLVWQAAELLYFGAFYQILLTTGGGSAFIPDWGFTAASMLRWLALASLCVLVLLEILQPRLDVVWRKGLEDPEGGVLNDSAESPLFPDQGGVKVKTTSPATSLL